MSIKEELTYTPSGKKECKGRVFFSIEWTADSGGDSAKIILTNLDSEDNKKPKIEKFTQAVREVETSVEFRNKNVSSFISVWMKKTDKGVIQLFLSYPIDSHDEFQSVIAVWKSTTK